MDENQFADQYNPNTSYKWNQDPNLLNLIWTRFLNNSGTFVGRSNLGSSLDDAYALFEDYPNNNDFSENIYLTEDISDINFFCDDDVSMILYKTPFDYVSFHLEGSDTNLVTLERISASIITAGIGTTTVGIATTNVSSFISCTPVSIDNVKFNVDTFDVGFVGGGEGKTNIRGDLKVNVNRFTVNAATGITSCLGDFRVNTDKFTVNATSGITSCLGDFRVNTDKFTVNATSGITSCLGDFIVNTDKFTVNATSGITSCLGDFIVNTDKFTVNATTGRVGIGIAVPTDNLHVIGSTLITGSTIITGITTIGISSAASSPPSNYQLSFELTSNTNLVIRVRGSDGALRSANITLT